MQVSELLKIVMEEKPHSFSESKIISWRNEVECEVQQQLGISPFVLPAFLPQGAGKLL